MKRRNKTDCEIFYNCEYFSKFENKNYNGPSKFVFKNGDEVIITEELSRIPFELIILNYLRDKKIKRILNKKS